MRAVLPLLLAGALVGCSATTTEIARLSSDAYPPLPEAAPVALTTGDLDDAYQEIAVLNVEPEWKWKYLLPWVHGGGSVERLNRTFREGARAIGADAVVRIDYELDSEGSRATGTAVRRLGS